MSEPGYTPRSEKSLGEAREAGLDDKLARLAAIAADLAPGLVAVSGGLDSRLLSLLLRDHGLSYQPVFFTGPHLSPNDRAAAMRWFQRLGVMPLVFAPNLLSLDEVRLTAPDRCFHCKLKCFQAALEAARERSRDSGEPYSVIEGSNASDASEYRPGLAALARLGVRCPLAEAGMTKADVRLAARRLGLPEPEQPSRPCLLTRFPYGASVDATVLRRLGAAEDALAALGPRDFRLRVKAPGVFSLQLGPAEGPVWERVESEARRVLEAQGFPLSNVEIVEAVSGYYDRSHFSL